jgi:hypothetical protein
MLPPCYQCGTVYEGNRCPECVARNSDIQRGFLYLGGAAVIGEFLFIGAIHKYPPLWVFWFDFELILFVLLFPAFVMFVLYALDQLERRVVQFGLVLLLAASVLPLRAGYIYFNGALDRHPPLIAQSVISDAHIENRKDGPRYVLGTYVFWNQGRIYQDFFVSQEIYYATHPGDAIQLALHGGAFSTPWAGAVDLSTAKREYKFKFSPRM